ncbi:TonB-dependent receptor [Sulfidibacter corallicola]|uniref:TonB-dependent receptor n=1 Tax=Sulfidibacter corallicola TaxID=2818388 RepID=A0A8A4TWX1_SULCO|nr:TonB-dependent receptor [Sulfidibacter corallicola]QTD51015.1 TonB-dependent receptor [Sulfidibacter corallicola]
MSLSKSIPWRGWVVLCAALFCVNTFAGDDTHGFLMGTVATSGGETVPGVVVVIENQDTGLKRDMVTSDNGTYRFPALPLGKYTVTATMTGFQTAKKANVHVGLGAKTTLNLTLAPGDVSEVITVTAAESLVDTTSTTFGLNVRTEELTERVPVVRDQTAVALLAPGSTEGDQAFETEDVHGGQKLASLGGASVAENAYLVNGLNTTNFRNGLGSSTVPFEFLEELQVKTGGYQAEFGRSTGGVINTVTKSGTNEFHYGVTLYWEPDSLASESPDTIDRTNSVEERDVMDANIYVSGPIVKDRAFFYALYNPRDSQTQDARVDQDRVYESDDAFWGAKFDWHITPNHTLELTAFSDETDRDQTNYDFVRGSGRGDLSGTATHQRGGDNLIAKYTGTITPTLFVSAQFGKNKFNRTSESPLDVNPRITEIAADGSNLNLGSWVNRSVSEAEDEREAMRLDLDWYVQNHSIRAGFDFETNTSFDKTNYSGDIWWRYESAGAGNIWGIAEGTPIVRERVFRGGGEFEVKTTAIYIQDSWAINEKLTLNVGLRNETFDNRNAEGNTFIKVDNQIAPRIGFIYDPKGDSSSKIYANFGRYYLPIASNTNIRMSGAEFFTEGYYEVTGRNGDDSPIFADHNSPLGGDISIFGDGTVPDTSEILDTSIEPMYQDEFVIGYETKISENWSVGVRGVHRTLGEAIEDIAVDAALNEFVGDPDFAHGFDFYVLTNPGTDLTFSVDTDGDGDLDSVTLTAEALGYPKAEREYYAAEFTFQRAWENNWMIQGSYTWAHSYGNYEGWVRSDNGQDDAGITTNFDQPGLLDGGYGNLPNDRRHNLKVFGAYALDSGLSFGANLSVRSGRPQNAFGVHPTDEFAAAYGQESFYVGGQLVPRGSQGTTPTVSKVDLSAQYPFTVGNGQINLRMDIFNVFDFDEVTQVVETAEQDNGSPDPAYLTPRFYQTPRTVRFSAQLRF